jgi:hypothetical protein
MKVVVMDDRNGVPGWRYDDLDNLDDARDRRRSGGAPTTCGTT